MDKREKVKDILVKYTEPVLKYDGITLHEVSGMIEKIYQEASDYEWEGEIEVDHDGCYYLTTKENKVMRIEDELFKINGKQVKIKITVREVI